MVLHPGYDEYQSQSGLVVVSRVRQLEAVHDSRGALAALTASCLQGALDHVGINKLTAFGLSKRQDLTLMQLAMAFRPDDDGLHGVGFEWAVHEAINAQSRVTEYVADALDSLRVPHDDVRSVFFGSERASQLGYLDGVLADLGQGARLRTGSRGQPSRLAAYLPHAARGRHGEPFLPPTLQKLWKADLLIGSQGTNRWIAATLKYKATDLRGGPGLRLGITPATRRVPPGVREHPGSGLTWIALPMDSQFMTIFNTAWNLVRQILGRHLGAIHPTNLPDPSAQDLARQLTGFAHEPVVEIADHLRAAGQPSLAIIDAPSHEQLGAMPGLWTPGSSAHLITAEPLAYVA